MKYSDDKQFEEIIKYLVVNPSDRTNPLFRSAKPGAAAKLRASNLINPFRKEIFDKMVSSTETFTFTSLQEAQEHWSLRIRAVDYMKQMNSRKVQYLYHNIKVAPSVSSAKWRTGPNGSAWFIVNNGVPSFAAINDLFVTVTQGECGGAYQACVLKAAADILGQGEFDKLHPDGSLGLDWSSIDEHTYFATDTATKIPGDYLFMKNVPDYEANLDKLNKKGFWHGENAFYMGGENYSGLGILPVNENQMRQKLANMYNAEFAVLIAKGKLAPAPLDQITFTSHERLRVRRRARGVLP